MLICLISVNQIPISRCTTCVLLVICRFERPSRCWVSMLGSVSWLSWMATLSIFRGHLSQITYERHPIALPLGRGIRCLCEFEVWSNFELCVCWSLCDNVLNCDIVRVYSIIYTLLTIDDMFRLLHIFKICQSLLNLIGLPLGVWLVVRLDLTSLIRIGNICFIHTMQGTWIRWGVTKKM